MADVEHAALNDSGNDAGNDAGYDSGGRAWMLGFVDLLLLLFTFFVLLFAMSQVRQDAWNAIVRTLQARLNPDRIWVAPEQLSHRDVPRVTVARAYDLDYLGSVLDEKILADATLAHGHLQRIGDRLLISFPADLLFAPGDATLSESAEKTARALGAALQYVGNRVEVVGHADPVPPSAGSPFASNWELSLARAVAMANAIRQAGYGFDIDAYGVGDSRFQGLSPALGPEARRRLARRVDLIIRETSAGEELQ